MPQSCANMCVPCGPVFQLSSHPLSITPRCLSSKSRARVQLIFCDFASKYSVKSNFFSRGYRQAAARRTLESELNEALASSPFAAERGAASVRINEEGELVASVTVPIRLRWTLVVS